MATNSALNSMHYFRYHHNFIVYQVSYIHVYIVSNVYIFISLFVSAGN